MLSRRRLASHSRKCRGNPLVDFFNGEGSAARPFVINPMGEVPVLDADGHIMTSIGADPNLGDGSNGEIGRHGANGSCRSPALDPIRQSAGLVRGRCGF